MSAPDLGDVSLLELFREEAESQKQVLTSGLLALERDHAAGDQLELCMRAAHSLKGAASIVGLTAAVRVAHAMEDCFVAAQQGQVALLHTQIDVLLGAADLLMRIANTPEAMIAVWAEEQKSEIDWCVAALARILVDDPSATPVPHDAPAAQSFQRRDTDGVTTSADR